jgi:hypothetical protein
METTVDANHETASLIGSDKVEGTAVYGPDDRKIGTVQRVMIDKISGKVAYAVVSFGGFLGMGEDYYPMPWAKLDYDTSLGGYRVDITEDQLARLNSIVVPIGIGLTARVTGRCTTTTTRLYGTRRAVHILCLIHTRAGSDIHTTHALVVLNILYAPK